MPKRCNIACQRARAHNDTVGHDWIGPRHSAQCTLRHSAVLAAWAQCAFSLGSGCVHYALDPVLTHCTFLSHCLDHCSWTLFMNTVHGVLKKIKSNKNQIKSIFCCI